MHWNPTTRPWHSFFTDPYVERPQHRPFSLLRPAVCQARSSWTSKSSSSLVGLEWFRWWQGSHSSKSEKAGRRTRPNGLFCPGWTRYDCEDWHRNLLLRDWSSRCGSSHSAFQRVGHGKKCTGFLRLTQLEARTSKTSSRPPGYDS
jgi:hypothetical protein